MATIEDKTTISKGEQDKELKFWFSSFGIPSVEVKNTSDESICHSAKCFFPATDKGWNCVVRFWTPAIENLNDIQIEYVLTADGVNSISFQRKT